MPCRCDFDEYVPPRNVNKTMNANNTIEKQKKTIENLRNELVKLGKTYNDLKGEADKVTQLLCYFCGTLIYKNKDLSGFDNRLLNWWLDHDAWDKHRTLDTFKRQFGSNPDQHPDKTVAYEWFVKQAEDVHPLSDYHKNIFFHDVWEEFVAWFDGRKSRANRIAELKAELAKLEAEEDA